MTAPENTNRQLELDRLKHQLSCENFARFSLAHIRAKSLENLARWRSQGTWGPAYDEWLAIMEHGDDQHLIAMMTDTSDKANQMRQSMPYVGFGVTKQRSEENPKTERFWITEDGERLRIRDMTESHAKNALAYVMHVIDAGHPVWTDACGQFHFDPDITLPKPFDVNDAMDSIVRLQVFLEMYQEQMGKLSGCGSDSNAKG